MEGAKALEIPPCLLQPQVFRNQVHEIESILDLLDGVLLHRWHRRQLTVNHWREPLRMRVTSGCRGAHSPPDALRVPWASGQPVGGVPRVVRLTIAGQGLRGVTLVLQ